MTTSTLVYPGADGHLVYVPNSAGDVIPNFSMVGYETGVVPLPNTAGGAAAPAMETLSPSAGDQTTIIQNAINAVSAMPVQPNGFRGAVLLTAGNYPISGSLSITASGVVLEGQGNDPNTGTRLEATGTSTRVLINVSGSGSMSTVANTTHNITDPYVPVGATSFHVDSTANLAVGDTVVVQRPSTQAWIDEIGMNLLTNPWTPGSKNLNSDRVITAISGNQITIDAPLTNSLDQQYGGGTLYEYTWAGRIQQVGIMNLYTYSDSVSSSDANHANGFLTIDSVANAWVYNVTANNFALNVVEIGSGAKWVTFDDDTIENSSDTTTNITDAPAGIGNSGQEILVENITFTNAFHAIAVGSSVPGPNVYTYITITNPAVDPLVSSHSREETGPHQRWSTGGLFDNVTSSDWVNIRNAGNEGSGHGWQGANYVLWNVNARTDVSSPPTAQNWVIGGSASTSEGTAIYDQRGSTVTPQSLYTAQLLDRLTPTVRTAAAAGPATVAPGQSTTLSVLGTDAAGESTLIYTWAAISLPSGGAAPLFSSTNGTNAGKNLSATFSKAGTYVLQVTIQYPGGFAATSDVSVTVAGATISLGIFSAAQDIGVPAISGSSAYNTSTGVYTVAGAGSDISGIGDQFQFLYETFSGDGSITAQVTSITDTNASAKAGVMFRNSLDAGSTDLLLTASPGNGIKLEGRSADDASATIYDTNAALTAPYWIRLTRAGSTFTAYTSPDGQNWTELGSVSMTMNQVVYVGLAVTSHNTAALNTSTFQSVSVLSPIAAQSGSTLTIDLNNLGPFTVSSSGGNVDVGESGAVFPFAGVTAITLDGSSAHGVLNFLGPLTAPITLVGDAATTLNVSAGTLSFAVNSSTTLGAISIASGAGVVLPAGSPSPWTVGSLSIATGAGLDLTDNTLVVNYGSGPDPIAAITAEIKSGYNGGAGNGPGIFSSTAAANPGYAIGYADGDNAADQTATGVPAGRIEIMYTVAGDVNLSGSTDLSDLVIVSSDFGDTSGDWAAGDVNYDGGVDLSDLVIVSSNFGAVISRQVTIAAVIAPPAPAPEPIAPVTPVAAIPAVAIHAPIAFAPSTHADASSGFVDDAVTGVWNAISRRLPRRIFSDERWNSAALLE